MTKLLLITVSAALLALSTGCLFSKKGRKPKESSAIAGEVEETFRRRWVDKRSAELTAQGTAAEIARAQADAEFRERFVFAERKRK